MRMLLSVFTPTYNRANTLGRLFTSLQAQTCKDFEWIVVDDGSTDNTEKLLSEYKKQSSFLIKYIKQKNGGKHTAYNTALKIANGAYFFTVDSDDMLPENSVSRIVQILKENPIIDSGEIAGIIALKAYRDNGIIGKRFTADHFISSLYDLEHTGNKGERSIIIKLEIAKSFPFPVVSGEKFVPELVVYDRIDRHYKFFVSNEILTICEYQFDGLSSNPKRLMYNNPGGYVWYFVQRTDSTTSVPELIKYLIQVNAFKHLYAGTEKLPNVTRHKLLYWITKPIGLLAALHYKSCSR